MTPDQAAFIRKVQDSLKAATILRDTGFFDFAVSRAYYTMFYIAQAFLLEDGLTFSKHSAVISKFGEHFAKTGRVPAEFHRYLIDSQEDRHEGDYDPLSSLTQLEANEHIANAEKFLKLAADMLGDVSSDT